MPYRFLGADPGAEASEEVVAGVRALNACAAAQYERFLDLLMSFLISPSVRRRPRVLPRCMPPPCPRFFPISTAEAGRVCLCGRQRRPISLRGSFRPLPRHPQAIDLVAEVHGIAEGLGMKAKTVEVRPRGAAAQRRHSPWLTRSRSHSGRPRRGSCSCAAH